MEEPGYLSGFERKFKEIVGDDAKASQVLGLFPEWIMMPLFYRGDKAELDGKAICIDKVGMKGSCYIYFFTDENGEQWHAREEELSEI